jgi:hypothetical protein
MVLFMFGVFLQHLVMQGSHRNYQLATVDVLIGEIDALISWLVAHGIQKEIKCAEGTD